jgi:hypothetical protein
MDKEDHVTAIAKRMNVHARGHGDHSRGSSDDPFADEVVFGVASSMWIAELEPNQQQATAAMTGAVAHLLLSLCMCASTYGMRSRNAEHGQSGLVTLMIPFPVRAWVMVLRYNAAPIY